MGLTQVNSGGIEDGSIVNADIKSDSAIALSKLASTPAVLTGSTNNTITTVTAANAIQGEANLTFDGSELTVTGDIHVSDASPGIKFTDTDASGGFGMVGVNNTSGSLVLRSDDGNALSSSFMGFEVDGGEKARITSGGNVKINDGDLLIGTSGHGIDFGATSDASGATSEKLDDYEEGTWTGSLYTVGGSAPSGGSLSTNAGVYTKIGNLVTATLYISWDNQWTGAGASPGAIAGLPFTAGSSSAYGGVALAFSNLPSPGIGANNSLSMYVQSGQDYIIFYQLPGSSGGGGGTLNASSLFNSVNGYVNFTVSYQI